jgi:hypothetical protein
MAGGVAPALLTTVNISRMDHCKNRNDLGAKACACEAFDPSAFKSPLKRVCLVRMPCRPHHETVRRSPEFARNITRCWGLYWGEIRCAGEIHVTSYTHI